MPSSIPQIELKNLKYAAFASQETSCFEATVNLDGKRAGTVRNDGHGGCNMYHPWTINDTLEAIAKTLPNETLDLGDGEKTEMPASADSIIDNLLNDMLARRDLQRALGKKVLYLHRAGGIYETKVLDKARLAAVLTKPQQFKDATAILNLLPFEDALKLYRSAAASAA